MSHHPARTATLALATALVAVLAAFTSAAPASSVSSAVDLAERAADSSAAGPSEPSARAGRWQCGKWKSTGPSSGSRWCVRFDRITPRVKQDGKDLMHNNFKRTQKMHCELSRGTSVTFHAEGTIEAEAGVIFTKAKASVTAGASRQTTTTSTTGASFAVKGKGWAYCARGHAYFIVAGETRKQVCGEPGCRYYAGSTFNVRLPSSPFFEIGPGKNIDWKQFLPEE